VKPMLVEGRVLFKGCLVRHDEDPFCTGDRRGMESFSSSLQIK
jgi:hypothetical protein